MAGNPRHGVVGVRFSPPGIITGGVNFNSNFGGDAMSYEFGVRYRAGKVQLVDHREGGDIIVDHEHHGRLLITCGLRGNDLDGYWLRFSTIIGLKPNDVFSRLDDYEGISHGWYPDYPMKMDWPSAVAEKIGGDAMDHWREGDYQLVGD